MKALKNASATGWKRSNGSDRRRLRRFGQRRRLRSGRFVVVTTLRQNEKNDQAAQSEHGQDQDAAFGTGGASAEHCPSLWMRGQQMVLRHQTAVGDAI